MPADAIVPDAMYIETQAVTIAPPPECVWPWLAQMLIERVYGVLARLPPPLLLAVVGFGHRVMQNHLLRHQASRRSGRATNASSSALQIGPTITGPKDYRGPVAVDF